MLDILYTPAWIEKIIIDAKNSCLAELSLVILNGSLSQTQQHTSRLKRILSRQANLSTLLYYGYIGLDDRKHRHLLTAFKIKDTSELLKDTPKLQAHPQRTKFVDRFTEDDIQKIRSYKLDVILRFGFKIIKGDILSAARYGVWSYHHGDNNEHRSGPALFWESTNVIQSRASSSKDSRIR